MKPTVGLDHRRGKYADVCCMQTSLATVCTEESLCVLEIQLWLLATRQHVSHGKLHCVDLKNPLQIVATCWIVMILFKMCGNVPVVVISLKTLSVTEMCLQCLEAVGWAAGRASADPACKNWVVRYWRGYLSGVRCKYNPADATATSSSLTPVKSRMVYLSGARLPCWPGKRLLNGCGVVLDWDEMILC